MFARLEDLSHGLRKIQSCVLDDFQEETILRIGTIGSRQQQVRLASNVDYNVSQHPVPHTFCILVLVDTSDKFIL